jgi:hypothetical protein
MDLTSFRKEIKEVHKYSYYDKTETDDFRLFEYDSPDYLNKVSKFDYVKNKSSNMIELSTTDEKIFASYKKTSLALVIKKQEQAKFPAEKYIETTLRKNYDLGWYSRKKTQNLRNHIPSSF